MFRACFKIAYKLRGALHVFYLVSSFLVTLINSPTTICAMLILISFYYFPSRSVRYSACSVGGLLLLVGLSVLSWIDQDDGRHSFGHSGGTQSFLLPIKIYEKTVIRANLIPRRNCFS